MSPSKYMPTKTRNAKKPSDKSSVSSNTNPQGFVLGNCPQIHNKTKQKLYSNT